MFIDIANSRAPIRKFRAKSTPCPWHSDDIECIKVIRDEYHEQAISSDDPHVWAVYRKLRNHVTNMCREAKKDNIALKSGNPKDIWSVLKNLLPVKNHNDICGLQITNEIVTAA